MEGSGLRGVLLKGSSELHRGYRAGHFGLRISIFVFGRPSISLLIRTRFSDRLCYIYLGTRRGYNLLTNCSLSVRLHRLRFFTEVAS